MHSQVTVDIFCFSFFSVIYTFLRWRSNPELSAPDEAIILRLRGQILFLCQAVKMFISAVKFENVSVWGPTHYCLCWTSQELQLCFLQFPAPQVDTWFLFSNDAHHNQSQTVSLNESQMVPSECKKGFITLFQCLLWSCLEYTLIPPLQTHADPFNNRS